VQDIWYDVPVSPVRFYHKAHYVEENCPVAVEVAKRIINLPTHQYVTSEQAAHMARIITEEAY
jgi:dTDP-4-amino-4,6-dideoxygalactose transaminase